MIRVYYLVSCEKFTLFSITTTINEAIIRIGEAEITRIMPVFFPCPSLELL